MTIAVKDARKARARKYARSPRSIHPQAGPGLSRNPRPRAGSEISSEDRAAPIPTWKRFLDVLIVLLSLPVTLSLMVAVTCWIKLVSKGPALFRQERIGLNGKRFVLYKFRSMHRHADTRRHENHFRHLVRTGKPMVKLDLMCDSRLIPGGCLLRAAGLDELPQLLNVLRGDMSLVGPRPCLVEEYRFFTGRFRRRFNVLPGITGIWQVYGKGVTTFSEMNSMDAFYVRRSSPAMDLGLILRTPFALAGQLRQAFRHNRGTNRNTESKHSEDTAFSGYNPQRLG